MTDEGLDLLDVILNYFRKCYKLILLRE